MNRELKFKVYNKKYRRWIKLESIFNREDNDYDLEIIGQFTGLTDKNGEEIYEYDLVRYDRQIAIISFGEIDHSYNVTNKTGFHKKLIKIHEKCEVIPYDDTK